MSHWLDNFSTVDRLRDLLTRAVWAGAALAVAGIAGVALALALAPTRPDSRSPGRTQTHLGIGGVAGLILSVLVFGIGFIVLQAWWQRRTWSDADRRAQRIKSLSDSLSQALQDIEAIQREVARGSALLDQLKSETTMSSELAQMSAEQSAAVRSFVQAAVRRETSKGTLWSFAIAALFFGAGVLVAHFA